MHVMNDPKDPFFTSLQVGAYNKPEGTPCDPAYPCSSNQHLSKGGEIAMAVVITIVGILLVASLIWMFVVILRSVAK
jgi:endoglucanase